jgi:hypothetical protein
MALFTTTLGLYGGVLWSGELQGFIIHQMMPSATNERVRAVLPRPCKSKSRAWGDGDEPP